MKIFLEKAIFINRAPFDKMELDFTENEISVLSAVNGRGKTTILSHIVDAFHEFARPHFQNEYEGKENKFYRVSSVIHNLDTNKPSFVYLRFKIGSEIVDYLDVRNTCSDTEYNEAITIDNKIPFNQFQQELKDGNYTKTISTNFKKEKAEDIFKNNLLTYFPAYRYEQPGYLNDPYKIKLDFKKLSGYSGHLPNPIEVISGLPQLANWIMDIVLDNQYLNVTPDDISKTIKTIHVPDSIDKANLPIIINTLIQLNIQQKSELQKNLNNIVTNALIGKNIGGIRFGIGERNSGGTRIQLVNIGTGTQIYPSIFNLSSGEGSLLCLFGELLRQADNNKKNVPMEEINGIVLIDEIDKHLHIKLQKDVLPKLLKLFPNVQFIVSSHSPFLSMGLAEESQDRSKIIDLDNLGISKDPTTNDLYREVYEMMIGENERFKEKYESLEVKIKEGTNPLIITEGKTDIQHLKKAKEKLNITDLDIDFYEITEDWGDSKLTILLEQLSKVSQSRKIIGVFDRDVKTIIEEIEKDQQEFKNFNNNVYAFCIPIPNTRQSYENISIEFFYTDLELKTKKEGKCLYFNNEVEFRQSASDKKKRSLIKLDNPNTEEENIKKIFDENIGDLDWIHSKGKFAELVESDESFINGFDFNNFNLIFEKIKKITNPSQETNQLANEKNTTTEV